MFSVQIPTALIKMANVELKIWSLDKCIKSSILLQSLILDLNHFLSDPEEFLNSLLSQTLRASPFLELSSGKKNIKMVLVQLSCRS